MVFDVVTGLSHVKIEDKEETGLSVAGQEIRHGVSRNSWKSL